MEQGEAGIVGNEIDFDFLVAPDHDDILQNSSGRFPRKAREFKTVSVQMNRMDVVALVIENQPGVAGISSELL